MNYIVLIIIVLIVVGLFVLWRYEKRVIVEKQKDNPKETEHTEETKDSKPPFTNYDNGQCKQDEVEIFSTCSKLPKTDEEKFGAEANEGTVCTYRHLFKLRNNGMEIRKELWALDECLGVCTIKDTSKVNDFNLYILTDEYIFCDCKKISKTSILIEIQLKSNFINEEKKITKRKSKSELNRIIEIFDFNSTLHCLTDKGKIFIFVNNEWNLVEFFRGRDISNEEILRVVTCEVETDKYGIISFATKNEIQTYFDDDWNEIKNVKLEIERNLFYEMSKYLILRNNCHFVYSKNRTTILVIEKGKASLYFCPITLKEPILLKEVNNVIDACIDVNSPCVFYCIHSNKSIRKYSLMKHERELFSFDCFEMNFELNFTVREEKINGEGIALFYDKKTIWIISGNTCFKI